MPDLFSFQFRKSIQQEHGKGKITINGLLPKSLFARSERFFDKSKTRSSPACSGIRQDL
jgi:hypothetical protein